MDHDAHHLLTVPQTEPARFGHPGVQRLYQRKSGHGRGGCCRGHRARKVGPGADPLRVWLGRRDLHLGRSARLRARHLHVDAIGRVRLPRGVVAIGDLGLLVGLLGCPGPPMGVDLRLLRLRAQQHLLVDDHIGVAHRPAFRLLRARLPRVGLRPHPRVCGCHRRLLVHAGPRKGRHAHRRAAGALHPLPLLLLWARGPGRAGPDPEGGKQAVAAVHPDGVRLLLCAPDERLEGVPHLGHQHLDQPRVDLAGRV
mmetsp:Transcript_57964/g.180160  ORF Transcript_57964/g.180160 Transcript_57964/m.180160 type:complete len:254 (+) Transcript_57964:2754-3515(+)